MSNCELCGLPMPEGEEMFKYHGYSGPCPPRESQGNSEEAAFRKAMSQPAEVWYPCGCKASAGAPKHCPEHQCPVCHKTTIKYTQGVKHADGSDLCAETPIGELDALRRELQTVNDLLTIQKHGALMYKQRAETAEARAAQLEAALRAAIVCPSCLGEGEVTAECDACLSGQPEPCKCGPMTCPQCDGKKWDAPEKAIPLIEAALSALVAPTLESSK
jgi:hypothetical protein